MKKTSILIQARDAESAVERLCALGVVHVEHHRTPSSKDTASITDDIGLVNQAMTALSTVGESRTAPITASEELSDWKAAAHHIVDSFKRIEKLKEASASLAGTISRWEEWGNFEPADIEQLAERSVYMRLYSIPTKQLGNLPSSVIIKRISTSRGITNCAVISREKTDIPFKEVPLPAQSLRSTQAELDENRKTIDAITENLRGYRRFTDSLKRISSTLGKHLRFRQARAGMGRAGEIAYLTGYLPTEKTDDLLKVAAQQQWGVTVDDPGEDDRVPTLIRSPRWVSIINPVFKLIDVVPGYRELDISLWFLLFLSVFFGMLIADAGYGLIILILAFFAHMKWKKKVASSAGFILLYVFALCAMAWGVLTATFFGQEWLPRTVQPLLPALRDNTSVQTLCFFIGALHLSVAHLWRAILKLPSLAALSDLGWVSILWGVFFLARTLVLGEPFPSFAQWLLIGGIGAVLFLTSPTKNVLVGVGRGLGSLGLNLVNSFTDVVSYIRLFAVGLATVAIADAFNKMALSFGYGTVVAGLVTTLILLVGHTLNIILGPMSVLVHGVRLNVLEFCNHVDVKWSGFRYDPLKK
ncbi:MAG: hypothetical protein JSU65_12470 [Candidatus Zixiibacteriota bacterium]|nr:MAG: hypothetical protein JSU65_12470 [candidate division Zixibacteria bacterium]